MNTGHLRGLLFKLRLETRPTCWGCQWEDEMAEHIPSLTSIRKFILGNIRLDIVNLKKAFLGNILAFVKIVD